MLTEDTYSSGHLVLSHFGTCKCSNVETNFSWTCLVSGLLSFKHPSVLLFLLRTCIDLWRKNSIQACSFKVPLRMACSISCSMRVSMESLFALVISSSSTQKSLVGNGGGIRLLITESAGMTMVSIRESREESVRNFTKKYHYSMF